MLLGLVSVLAAVGIPSKSHPNGSACTSCHLGDAAANPSTARRLLNAQEQLCVKCHQAAVKISHPSGFVPGRALPAEYPLDWKGELTCSTCHEIHGSGRGLMRGTKRGRDFCLACHEPSFFTRMKDSGTSLMASGHVQLSKGTAAVDPHSVQCLGCHTAGGYAGGGTVSISSNGVVRHGSGSAVHPIGRVYRDVVRGNPSYQPETSLAQKNIMLSDGKVSCVSCHEVYKKEHGKLVMTMDKSALCFACHAL